MGISNLGAVKRSAAVAVLLAILVTLSSAPAARAGGDGRLIAPASACPSQANPDSALATQEQAMLCLANFARRGRGLPELASSRPLNRAADHKSKDILRCDSFSHEACGRPFAYWMERFGSGKACASAENIAWGTGRLGSVRSIFSGWMHSSGHRENILGPYDQIGIGLRVGDLEGNSGAHVWTQDFASHC
jgi:uncharacterized protein YkwD